jgi:hypothetical protein
MRVQKWGWGTVSCLDKHQIHFSPSFGEAELEGRAGVESHLTLSHL